MRPSIIAPTTRLGRAMIPIAILLSLVAIPVGLARPAEARRVDTTPPTFAGLKSAIACIPGPIGGGRTTTYTLSWDAAKDNATPSKKIVYDVFQAATSGGEDFSAPTYTTAAGATSFVTPALPTDNDFYFVVRARDQYGNSDGNKVERQGQNICA